MQTHLRAQGAVTAALAALLLWPLPAAADEFYPVGTQIRMDCGPGRDGWWRVVKNDGETYRMELDKAGMAVEGPIWGQMIGYATERIFGRGSVVIRSKLEEGGTIERVRNLEVGSSGWGFFDTDTPRGRTHGRYEATVKEKAIRETPFGPVEAYLIQVETGAIYFSERRLIWYAPSLKLAIETLVDMSNQATNQCKLANPPKLP